MEAAVVCSRASATEEDKQFMAGVGGFFDDAACSPQAPLLIDWGNGGEWGFDNALRNSVEIFAP